MNQAPGHVEIIQQRFSEAASELADDSRLRAELTDAQAKELLDWGLAKVRDTVERSANLDNEIALQMLDKTVTAVQTIMQLVNELLATVGQAPDFDLIDDRVTRLLKNLFWLTGRRLLPEELKHVERFDQSREAADRDQAFNYLLQLITSS